MERVEATQHRLAVRQRRGRVLGSRRPFAGHRVRGPRRTRRPTQPWRLVHQSQPATEIPCFTTGRTVPRHIDGPQEPEPPQQIQRIRTLRRRRAARRLQLLQEPRHRRDNVPAAVDQPEGSQITSVSTTAPTPSTTSVTKSRCSPSPPATPRTLATTSAPSPPRPAGTTGSSVNRRTSGSRPPSRSAPGPAWSPGPRSPSRRPCCRAPLAEAGTGPDPGSRCDRADRIAASTVSASPASPAITPADRRIGRDRPEQLRLRAHDSDVGQAVTAQGERRGQVDNDLARVVLGTPTAPRRQRHRQRSLKPTDPDRLAQQQSTRGRHEQLTDRIQHQTPATAILHPRSAFP